MANVQYYDVILKPVVTEKSMELMGEKKYTFLVHPEATKSQRNRQSPVHPQKFACISNGKNL